MEIKKIDYIIFGISLLVCILLFLLLREKLGIFYVSAVILILASILPVVIRNVIFSRKQKEKDARFLDFVKDLVENVKSGTPIGKSIVNLKDRTYGPLTEHVQKLINQLNMGITLEKALNNFAKDTKSTVIMRSVNLISEAERSGGEIEDLLNSVARSVSQTEQLRKEQKAAVYNLIVQGYIIFFIFIAIIIILQYYVIPMTSGISNINSLTVNTSSAVAPSDFTTPLFILLLFQAFFAGIVIGKISEGNFIDGLKHSFVLVAIALISSAFANLIFGGA